MCQEAKTLFSQLPEAPGMEPFMGWDERLPNRTTAQGLREKG